MATVFIPSSLASLANNSSSFVLEVANTAELFDSLFDLYPELASKLLDDKKSPRPFVAFFHNGINIPNSRIAGICLTSDCQVLFLLAVAGG